MKTCPLKIECVEATSPGSDVALDTALDLIADWIANRLVTEAYGDERAPVESARRLDLHGTEVVYG